MTKHAFTVDVEDWYHVENLRGPVPPGAWDEQAPRLDRNVDRLLALFERASAKATFFVLGHAAERHPDAIRRIAAAGHEVASHGWSHELVYRQDEATFRAETRRSKALLEDLSGGPVLGYRASTFSVTEKSLWALDVLAEEGFTYDSSIAPLRHDRYGIPDAPTKPHPVANGRLTEFPVSFGTVLGKRVPLGGGFFRLFPLGWTLAGLRRYAARGESAMLYVHPWEIDPDQPRVRGLPLLSRFRHYARLGATEAKIERLLASVEWTTMQEILS